MTTTGIRAGASASSGRLSLVPQTAWGSTPATPAFTNVRLTSESLRPSKEVTRSNEVRPDRNLTDEIMVGRSVAGDLSFELSYAAFDDLFEALMFSEWTDAIAPDLDTLKNGAGIGQAFTAERTITLPDASKEYIRFLNMMVNTMSLNVEAEAIVTGSFGMMGTFGGRDTAVITDATYTDAPQNRVLNAATHFANLGVTGGSLSESPLIQSLSLEVTNNLRAQRAVGNIDAAGMAPGRFEVTGSMTAYFSSGELYQAFLDHEDLALTFELGTESGSKYRFTLPTIILTGEPGGAIGGNDADVIQELSFTAVLDRLTSPTLLGCALMVERGVT